jgi:hypothetical protein
VSQADLVIGLAPSTAAFPMTCGFVFEAMETRCAVRIIYRHISIGYRARIVEHQEWISRLMED